MSTGFDCEGKGRYGSFRSRMSELVHMEWLNYYKMHFVVTSVTFKNM